MTPPGTCELRETPTAHELRCETHQALISMSSQPRREPALQGFVASLEHRGWSLQQAGTETLQVSKRDVEVARYAGFKGSGASDFLVGFVDTGGDASPHLVACILPRGSEAPTCSETATFLDAYARAHTVTGLELYGEPLSFPQQCEIKRTSVLCGNNAVSWQIMPGVARRPITKCSSARRAACSSRRGPP